MSFTRTKVSILLLLAAITAGCAQPSRTSAMIADVGKFSILAENSPLRSAVFVDEVTGGSETNPILMSQVDDGSFRKALQLSLKQHAMLGDEMAPLRVNATMNALDQPLFGASFTVTASVDYRVTNATGQTIFQELVTTPYTARFSDAFLGVERLRLANEGAIRTNIKRFIDLLIAEARSDPGRFRPPLTGRLAPRAAGALSGS